MFTFAHPYGLLLLLPLGVAEWRVYTRRRRQGLVFSSTSRLPAARAGWRTVAASLLPALVLLGVALAIMALARPRTMLSRITNSTEAIAIQMVVDVSGSMEALDLSVKTPTRTQYRTRLDAVKETFAEFVKQRPDDLLGLVTFGGYATTRVPLTTDHSALLHVLEGVEIPKPSQDASGQVADQQELLTAIGDALATACARLRSADPTSRVIVLLSDGESNTGDISPDQAIKLAEQLGIKVYTIGVGTTGRAPFWAKDFFGRRVIAHGEVALDEALLKRIAETTGARYFNVRDPKGLQRAMDDIDELEKTEIEREEYTQYDELFGWFLGPALGLIALCTCLNMVAARSIV